MAAIADSTDGESTESQIELFRRQFLQLEDPEKLALPPSNIVRRPGLQAKVYDSMFRDGTLAYPPPDRYKLRVLKTLVRYLEGAVVDPDEDEISDDITACLAELLSQPQVPDTTAAQQRSYVTYTSPTSLGACQDKHSSVLGPCTVTLLESRMLLAGSGTTGLRTWEAALRLGSFLVTPQASDWISGKSILELGAGTGFISILCAKHLGSRHVLATDGSGEVVDALKANLYVNGLEHTDRIEATVLRWGHALLEETLNGTEEYREYDFVTGADVTYDQRSILPLVATFNQLLSRNKNTKILISSTVRNEETVAHFTTACLARKMNVDIISQEHLSEEQLGFFHPTSVEIRLYLITAEA